MIPLKQRLKEKILVLDGAMGTAIQAMNLTAADFGGADLEGCNENLILSKPSVLEAIYKEYLKAGCDIIETNTFGATPLVLDEYGLGKHAHRINVESAKLARTMANHSSTKDHPRYVAGSMGPTTKAISVTGGVTFESLRENYYQQAKGLAEGGVDYLLLETCQDTRNIKAAFLGIDRYFQESGKTIPIAVSVTIEPMGTMLAGQSIEALCTSVLHRDLLYLGLNCATGPEFMTDHVRTLSQLSPFPVSCVPNAGLPDENGCYLETAQMLSLVLGRFIEKGWINVIGGCCGTHAGHIQELASLAKKGKPRTIVPATRSLLSGVDFLEITDEMRPVIVGERTNVIGSSKFKKMICEEKWEEASDIARSQIKGGAHILDVCLANPDRDELEDMKRFLEVTVKKVRVPLMIDSTDEKVIAVSLTYSQGKAIINSVNLEDGEDRFEKVLPLARQFGAAVVVGTIDDDPSQGMGVTRARKLAIAEREFELLTKKYGIPAEDIYWDPLVFPCATGDAQYVGSAEETIEGIRLIKQKFPQTKTILGISNVSFGLPPSGRTVLNSVFLYHCVQAGLDLAIVSSEKLERYAGISEAERVLSENLLFNRGQDPIGQFAAHFRKKKAIAASPENRLPLMDRLPRYIIEGSKDGLVDDLKEALKTLKPLEVINGPLMKGMDEVGRLFNKNQLIVAEVLQSAEAMKAAVNFLEPFMEKSGSSLRGKVLLATVKGDVHDIGKNLVEIILANNGFQVINLGIKVPPEQLIQAIKEHKPDLIGLSGLLVKSAHQMVTTVEDLTKAGVLPPLLVGGAALSENFVNKKIAAAYGGTVAYASDAMSGLDLAKAIVQPETFEKLKGDLRERRASANAEPKLTVALPAESQERSATIAIQPCVPQPPDFDRHVLRNTPFDQIWNYINPLMLYGRHLGLSGDVVRNLDRLTSSVVEKRKFEADHPTAYSVWRAVEEVKQEYRGTEILQPSGVYQFFEASSRGNQIRLKDIAFDFPRQRRLDGFCLADYVNPEGKDNIALFVVTIGKGIRLLAENLKNRGDYLKSHIIQVLALESAEGYAEFLHAHIRKLWGFPDPTDMTKIQRFQAKYHGKRYSFGYPACPRLDDQTLLFKCLRPEEIGVQLTDGFMMDPEASVSALVFHHPQATYFSVGGTGKDATDAT